MPRYLPVPSPWSSGTGRLYGVRISLAFLWESSQIHCGLTTQVQPLLITLSRDREFLSERL